MTYSIGMRAPTLSEFIAGMARVCDTEFQQREGENLFYADRDLTEIEAQPGLISDLALRRARSCFSTGADLDDTEFASVFGSIVTDVKAWLAPEPLIGKDIESFINTATGEVSVHGMARLAYCKTPVEKLIFVNGHVTAVDGRQMEFFRQLCERRSTRVAGDDLFKWLAEKGAFDCPAIVWDDAT